MSLLGKRVLQDALDLSDEERAEVAAKLIQSLDGDAESDVDEAWAAEIERRCVALDAGETVTSDWDEVRRRIEAEILRK